MESTQNILIPSTSGQGGSAAQPLESESKTSTPEGDLFEDTLVESLNLRSVTSEDISVGTLEDTLLGHSNSDTDTTLTESARPKTVIDITSAKPKKLSGAARRRKKRMMAEQAKGDRAVGETVSVTSDQPQLSSHTGEASGATLVARTQTSIAKKRTGGTPDEGRPVQKKNKPDYTQVRFDYSQVAAKSLQVAVIFRGDPTRKITETERQHIWRQLVQLIDMLPQNSQAPGPRFDKSGLSQGVYRITCADQSSLTWLRDAVPRIEAIEGHSFEVMELSQLNRLKSVRVWIPGEKSNPKLILSSLSKQNQG